MASNFLNIAVLGLGEVLKNIDLLDRELVRRIDLEIEASCLTMVRDMKRAAPTNVGRLKNLISYVKVKELDYKLVSAANYTAYMEFGTKSETVIPAGYEDLAAQFRGVSIDTGGQTLKEAIYTWAKQKGIDKKYWYGIYKKILIKGVKPHPFFIPALVELTQLENRIQKILSAA